MPYGAPETVFISVAIVALILITTVGNVLVCCAVFLVRKLRHPSNYLLVSLAVADFLVGVIVMPFACFYHISGVWTLGEIWCEFWVDADVLLCTASILNLGAISVDRYWAIARPLVYVPKRTTKRILIYCRNSKLSIHFILYPSLTLP